MSEPHLLSADAADALARSFHQSRVGMAVLDTSLRFVHVNAALAQINRRSVEAHRGRTMVELFGVNGASAERLMRQVLESDRPVIGAQVSGTHPDTPQTTTHFEATYTPLRRGGEIVAISAIVLDVTARVEAERERDRLLLSAQRASQRARLRAELGTELEATRGAEHRMQRLVDLLVPVFADLATVELVDGDSVRLAAAAHRDVDQLPLVRELGLHHAFGLLATRDLVQAVSSADAQYLPHVTSEMIRDRVSDPATAALLSRLAPGSSIGVALGRPEGTIAALTLVRTAGRDGFDDLDVDFAQDLAQRAGLSIENERLYEREHRTVQRLQSGLLAGAAPDDDRLEQAAFYRSPPDEPAAAGGDWHDIIARPDGRIALIIGDVVGHGLEAAATMGQLRSAARALALICPDPAGLLELLDEFAHRTPRAACATVACALLDLETGILSYACAGHPPPLVVADGQARYLPGGRSAPLAVDARIQRVSAEAELALDSTLLLYTDGLVERRARSLDAELDRLGAVALELADTDPATMVERLVASMLEEQDQTDDIAVLIARPRLSVASPGCGKPGTRS